MNNILRVFFMLFISQFSLAQSVKYRNFNFEWPVEKPINIAVNENFKNEDAVILEEKCIYNQAGNRVPGYYFINLAANYFFIDESTQGITPVIQKHIRIKFLTQKGIDKFNKITLPESFDPSNDYYSVRPQWRDSALRPLGGFECIRYFAARILKTNGNIVKALVKEKNSTLTLLGDKGNENYYTWTFSIMNLEPGDELEADYSYEGVYNYGPSNRIFFNSNLPKQKSDFTFRYPQSDIYIFTYHNGVVPNDSVMVTKNTPSYTEYYFHFENLSAGINEPGGRPYLQMPYLSFYKHRLDYGIEDPKTKFIKNPLPYPWSYIMLPYAGYQFQELNLRLSRNDNTTQVMNTFTKDLRKDSKDTSAASVISVLQHRLAEKFIYQEDEGYYNDREPQLEKLGKYIEQNILRQMSRLRIYDEVMMRLEKPYYYSVLIDKRISAMDPERYETMAAARLGIAIPYGENIINFYPKSYRSGYESNELPFYYEDIYSFLIPQNESWEKKFELVPYIKFKFAKTPFSRLKDNTRRTSGMINVSLDSSNVSMALKINLSGQFSTLTRGYYQYGEMDTTVNPAYYSVIAEVADNAAKVHTEVSELSKTYPFDITITQKFEAKKLLRKNSGKEISISLNGLFNNITERNFTSENRHLDYYPDFQSQDIHRYFIHFDHKIKPIELDGFSKKIENDFAIYEIKLTQTGESDVLLESSYIIKTNVVKASQTNSVETIFDVIHALNSSSLKFTIQD